VKSYVKHLNLATRLAYVWSAVASRLKSMNVWSIRSPTPSHETMQYRKLRLSPLNQARVKLSDDIIVFEFGHQFVQFHSIYTST